ncbi:hypothetical protein NL676_003387 [Syzygium grande]|nr:hypothetical protein NL676_003387 [Syzygium grande]
MRSFGTNAIIDGETHIVALEEEKITTEMGARHRASPCHEERRGGRSAVDAARRDTWEDPDGGRGLVKGGGKSGKEGWGRVVRGALIRFQLRATEGGAAADSACGGRRVIFALRPGPDDGDGGDAD